MKLVNNVALQTNDQASLKNHPHEDISQAHLDKLKSVQIVHETLDNGLNLKEKMLYFLEDGRVLEFEETELRMKDYKELEHVNYLLSQKNEVTRRWALSIKKHIDDRRKFIRVKTDKPYEPMLGP